MKANIKLAVRYVILTVLMLMAWTVITPEYLLELKNIDSMILNVVIVSVFGLCGWVVKANWDTKISE